MDNIQEDEQYIWNYKSITNSNYDVYDTDQHTPEVQFVSSEHHSLNRDQSKQKMTKTQYYSMKTRMGEVTEKIENPSTYLQRSHPWAQETYRYGWTGKRRVASYRQGL